LEPIAMFVASRCESCPFSVSCGHPADTLPPILPDVGGQSVGWLLACELGDYGFDSVEVC
jgi:hypothetical protein